MRIVKILTITYEKCGVVHTLIAEEMETLNLVIPPQKIISAIYGAYDVTKKA